MAKLTKKATSELSNQEAMVLINKYGLPEGSHEEMIETLLEHFGDESD